MEWFINEVSLHSQFSSIDEVVAASTTFLGMIRAVTEGVRHRSERLMIFRAIKNEHLLATVNRLPRDLKQAFLTWAFDRSDPHPWEHDPCSVPTDYWLCLEQDVSGTTIAEAATRRRQGRSSALLNFERSFLAARVQVEAVHNRESVTLLCFEHRDTVHRWIESRREVPVYGPDTRTPPDDRQTCLVDLDRFEPTGQSHKGRRIYRERTTSRRFYVDGGHCGGAAELEVFDKVGYHLGTADLNGRLRPSSQVKGRRIED